MREKIMKSEVGRGVTVALISAGMTLVFLSPIMMMQIMSNLIN